MCLGIPGRVVAFSDDSDHLARVDVTGVVRDINVAMLGDEPVGVGDWVLIHMGFAVSVIDAHEAARALDGLRLMGSGLPPGADGSGLRARPDGDGAGT